MYPCTCGAVERSTEEPRSSRTRRRERRTRSESVFTTIPGSALREQAGTRVREPSTSTTQMRQTLTGVRFSRKQRVGVSIPSCRAASRRVEPSDTETGRPSIVSSTWFLGRGGGATGIGPRGTGIFASGAFSAAGIGFELIVSCISLSLRIDREPGQSRFDSGRGGLAQAADRGIAHHLAELLQERQLLLDRAQRPVGGEARQHLLLAHGAHPAGDALAAR